jgi:hypothetical protein
MSELMDRVCANCNRRYGEHYGGHADPDFCVHEEYTVWRKAGGGKIRAQGLFLNSGKFRGEHEAVKEWIPKDPNILFLMKKTAR